MRFGRRLDTAVLGIVLAAAATTAAFAEHPVDREVAVDGRAGAAAGYDEVDSIPVLTRPHSFEAIDRDTLVIWRTPFEPYLVELRRPSPDLAFARGIGVTSWAGRIHARFDAVTIGGLRYPIDKIYRLDREEAKRLGRES